MVDAVEVFSEPQDSDKPTIQFDERRAIAANKSHAARLRVALSPTHIYLTGNAPPGPWYRLLRGKRGLYRIPRASVQSITVISDRVPSTRLFIWLILYADLRHPGPLSVLDGLLVGAFLVAAILMWFLSRRFGLRLYTSDGFFYSVTETGFGRAKVSEGLAWASRVKDALRAADWPVGTA